MWLQTISEYACAAPCLSVVLERGDYMISKTNLKYYSASLIPIFADILPIAIDAIALISVNGSHSATFNPIVMILMYGKRSYGFWTKSTILPITWQDPDFKSELLPLMQ